jgi:hypothetical protein
MELWNGRTSSTASFIAGIKQELQMQISKMDIKLIKHMNVRH